jgi:hypothetical protein
MHYWMTLQINGLKCPGHQTSQDPKHRGIGSARPATFDPLQISVFVQVQIIITCPLRMHLRTDNFMNFNLAVSVLFAIRSLNSEMPFPFNINPSRISRIKKEYSTF